MFRRSRRRARRAACAAVPAPTTLARDSRESLDTGAKRQGTYRGYGIPGGVGASGRGGQGASSRDPPESFWFGVQDLQS